MPGTYDETVLLTNHEVTIGSQFLFTGDTAYIETTIWRPSEQSMDTACCLLVREIFSTVSRVAGVTFQNGRGAVVPGLDGPAGGAIYVDRSNLELYNCVIIGSSATYGGGIAAFGGNFWTPYGHLRVNNSLVQECESEGWGGALYANTCSLTVENSRFANNSALADGGGIIALDCVTEIYETSIANCTGVTGGIHVAGKRSVIENCTFLDNISILPYYWASHFSHGQGNHSVRGSYFGASASLSRGFNFCCTGDTIFFVGNVVENLVATAPFGTGNFAISGVHGEMSYNIIRNNRTRGEQVFPLGGTTVNIHHNYFTGNVSDFPDRPSVLKIGQNPNQTFHHNFISGNSGQTIGYTTDPGLIDARNNWWGHESGPYHPTRNPFGQGDTILSDSVLFEPWLLTPPDTSTFVSSPRPETPVNWKLLNVYPNPFNSELTISLAGIMGNGFSLKLYDTLGREVATLHEGRGHGQMIHYSAPPQLATGVYFLQATEGHAREVKKVVFLK